MPGHESSLPRGVRLGRRAAGLLTRGSLPRRLPGPRASGISARERLPSQRRDRPGFAPDSLTARLSGPSLSWSVMALTRRFALWGPVLVWAGLIFALSSIPSLSTGLGGWDEILRKGAHVTEYAVLGALLLRALGREVPALGVGLHYAASDELHQHFVRGRHSSPFDVAFDACGLAVGLLLFLFVQSERARA